MDPYDDSQRLRVQQRASDSEATRDRGVTTRGAPCFVVQTVAQTTYPTIAESFFATEIVTVLGTEAELAAGDLRVASGYVYCLNLGSAIPPMGTNVLATFVDNRWVFRYDG